MPIPADVPPTSPPIAPDIVLAGLIEVLIWVHPHSDQ